MAPEVQIKRCCVLNCSTQRTGKNDVNKTAMHKLPPAFTAASDHTGSSQKTLRSRWLMLAGRKEKDITPENEYVCGNHFTLCDYLLFSTDNKKFRKLDPRAEPSESLPVNKKDTESKHLPTEHLNGGQRSAKRLTGADENETNLKPVPSDGKTRPVQATAEIEDSSSQESTEPTSTSKGSTQSKTGSEESVTEKLVNGPGSATGSSLERKSDAESGGDSTRNGFGVELAPNCNSENVQMNSPMEEDSTAKTSRSASTELSTASMSVKTTENGPPSKEELDPPHSQGTGISKVNGSAQLSNSNDTGVARTSGLKRRLTADSGQEAQSEAPRKRLNEDPKPQARMKIRPLRSDLQSDAGAISFPDVVAGTENKYGYLNGFTEALLNAAIYQLNKAFETRNTQLTGLFQQLTVDACDIEKKYGDITCRLNACKPAGATRCVGVQVSNHPSALPTLIAETPGQPSSASTSNSRVSMATQLGAVKHTARRGRPPNAARFAGSRPTQTPRVIPASESVIDLTDDHQPTVSIVRAQPQPPAARTGGASQPDENLPGQASKFTTSYSRAIPMSPVKLPQSISITQTAVSPASKPDLSSGRTGTTVRSLPLLLNQPATSKLLAASTAPQPVPVGSIFPGQSPSTNPVVAQNGISQTKLQTQSPEKINVVGKTFRLPPGIEMKPVSKSGAASPALSPNSATQVDQPNPQLERPAQQSTEQRSKLKSNTGRVRHPAPLPETPVYSDAGERHTPPAPIVEVNASDNGIVLTWDMKLQANLRYLPAEKYQVFTYTEGDQPPSTDLWRNIGTISALQLPMAVTLCAYKPGFRYYFAVRGVDRLDRFGAFSEPKAVDLRESIVL